MNEWETLDSFFSDSRRIFGEYEYRLEQLALESICGNDITLDVSMKSARNFFNTWLEKLKKLFTRLLEWVKSKFNKKKKQAEFFMKNAELLKKKAAELGKDFKYKGHKFLIVEIDVHAISEIDDFSGLADKIRSSSLKELKRMEETEKGLMERFDANKTLYASEVLRTERSKTIEGVISNYNTSSIGEPKTIKGFSAHNVEEMLDVIGRQWNFVKTIEEYVKIHTDYIEKIETQRDSFMDALEDLMTTDGSKYAAAYNIGRYRESRTRDAIEIDIKIMKAYEEVIGTRYNEFSAVLNKLYNYRVDADKKEEFTEDNYFKGL